MGHIHGTHSRVVLVQKKNLGNCLRAFTIERDNGFHLAGLEIDFDVSLLFATYHPIFLESSNKLVRSIEKQVELIVSQQKR